MGLQKFANNAQGTTTTVISTGGVSFTLQSGEGAEFPALSGGAYFYVRIGSDVLNEVVRVTGRSADTFTCDPTTLAWAGGTPVLLGTSKEMLDDMTQYTDALIFGMAIARMRGAGSGDSGVILSTGDVDLEDDLKVVPQDVPDMTVKVKAGVCIVNGLLAGIPYDLDVAVAAPDTNDQISIIQINQNGDVTVKYGVESGSPVAPTPDVDNYELGSILLTTAHTIIDTGDCTDPRVAI